MIILILTTKSVTASIAKLDSGASHHYIKPTHEHLLTNLNNYAVGPVVIPQLIK